NDYFIDINDISYRNEILNMIDQLISYSEINENAKFKIFIDAFSSINSDTNFDIELARFRGYGISTSIIDIVNEDRSSQKDIINKIIFDWTFDVNNIQST